MLFNSPEFILLFLPIVVTGYFLLNRLISPTAGKAWLVAGSLFFYAYWKLIYLGLILLSIDFNYWVSRALSPSREDSGVVSRQGVTGVNYFCVMPGGTRGTVG